jgi:septal ring factor EnvC (AmiA/AmiB activator)
VETENITKVLEKTISKLECVDVYLAPDLSREIVSDTITCLMRLQANLEQDTNPEPLICDEIEIGGNKFSEIVNSTKKQLTYHRNRIKENTSDIDSIAHKLDAIKSSLNSCEARLQRLQTVLDAHSQRLYLLEEA